jgi:hypothetical protein
MFRRPLLLILLLSPALLGAGSWYFWPRAIEPLSATPREVCEWLLQNDAATATPALQAALHERCRLELLDTSSTLDWTELSEALKSVRDEQRACWERNVCWWCQQWWFNEARAYAAVSRAERAEYLQKQIVHWKTHEFVALGKLRSVGVANTSTELTPTLLAELSVEIESWIANAEPSEQPQLQEFWAALRWQLLAQSKFWKGLSF